MRRRMQRSARRAGEAAMMAAGVLAGVAAAGLSAGAAQADELSSDWVEGFNSRTRLAAGRVEDGAASRLMAFVEIEMPKGWKTYWKSPGESGIPPMFDWSKSGNVKTVTVLYPAPKRIGEASEEIIGYKDYVIFPVEITAADAKAPVSLDAVVQFGICKDICVPAEAKLTLDIAPDATGEVSASQSAALATVPRSPAALRSSDPVVTRAKADLKGAKPKLVIEATFPGGAAGADVFLDAPGGAYMPPARKVAENGAEATFEADFSKDVDLERLKGAEIGITLVGKQGQSMITAKLE